MGNEVPNDGDPCDSTTEEVSGGLCYQKCSLLTNNVYDYRISTFSCCKKDDCTWNPFSDCCTSDSFIPCSGYDVAGDGSSCPHGEGDCLTDEELFLGVCYEKCSITTKGKEPYRIGPA